MKATVLVDNTGAEGLTGEWGLSIHIAYEGHNILLDTGASGLFLRNAKALGLDIGAVDAAVLSHAHCDHANGMAAFFGSNRKAQFYLREGTAENAYKKVWLLKKYIGLPRGITTRYADRITYAKGDLKLYEGVWLVPHKTEGLETCGRRENMLCREGGRWQYDSFRHEQSLVFDTAEGLVIFNSCSHGGAAAIIDEVAATFPEKKVRAMIGGFHLYNKTEEEVRALAEKIRATGVGYICTGHCTKDRAYAILQEELGEAVHKLQVGMVMDFS